MSKKSPKNALALPPGDVLNFQRCSKCGEVFPSLSIKHYRNSDGTVERYVSEAKTCPACGAVTA
jgi:uncharacterized protein with PIN domain